MGEPDSSNMAKLLLATLALLAVANATTVYMAVWETSTSCAGTATEVGKTTLNLCYKVPGDETRETRYGKVSLTGSDYKLEEGYKPPACTGHSDSDNVIISPVGTCYGVEGEWGIKFLRDSPGASKNTDCTSGTCVVNSASHATIGFIGIIAIFVGLVTNSM